VRLSIEELDRLDTLIRVRRHPSRLILKVRILLKADASESARLERQTLNRPMRHVIQKI